MPVLPSICATTIPPNSSRSGPPAVFIAATKLLSCRIPSPTSTLTPSSVATAMSITSNAIARITAPKTARVM